MTTVDTRGTLIERRRKSLPPLCLAYHGVAAVRLRRDVHGIFTRPRDLRRHIGRLRTWGYRFLPFGEWAPLATSGEAAGYASLTFDDGLEDNLTTLLPLLRELDVPATVFVASAWLGGQHPDAPWARILDADGVRALDHSGVEVGAHSAEHSDLTTLPYDEVVADLVRGREELEAVLDRAVPVLAYPYGRVSDETMRAARAAGFLYACATAGHGSLDEPLRLPRQAMANDSTLLGLRLKRSNTYERLMRQPVPRVIRKLKRVVQRAVR
jgi:peptidoglycan/xylan/chitin deacetylase (PgdA/CDA1 family)